MRAIVNRIRAAANVTNIATGLLENTSRFHTSSLLRSCPRSDCCSADSSPFMQPAASSAALSTHVQHCLDRNTLQSKSNMNALLSLIDSRQAFHSMPQPFYISPLVYSADMAFLWKRAWLFACYTCEIPNNGDYVTFEVDQDSMIIIKDNNGKYRCFHNVCRHRGSRLVSPTQKAQHTKHIVCPYHAWSYTREGKLNFAREMGPTFDKDQYNLHEVHCHALHGLIFICITPIADKPLFPFRPAAEYMTPQLQVHELDSAKLAYSQTYTVSSNWKLIYENNRECYHCLGAHPEYIKSNYDLHLIYKQNADGSYTRDVDPSVPQHAKVSQHINDMSARWEKQMGLSCSPGSHFPDDGWYRCSRMPLKAGWVTESLDGKPVCNKLLGRFDPAQRDMGSFRIHTLPNYWIHASSDHAVSSRIAPISPLVSQIRVDWLVHKDAIEGQDYSLDKLLPFWQRTSDQDWRLCEVNMAGVRSSVYQPGRLSESKESGLERYILWYLSWMKSEIEKQQAKLQ